MRHVACWCDWASSRMDPLMKWHEQSCNSNDFVVCSGVRQARGGSSASVWRAVSEDTGMPSYNTARWNAWFRDSPADCKLTTWDLSLLSNIISSIQNIGNLFVGTIYHPNNFWLLLALVAPLPLWTMLCGPDVTRQSWPGQSWCGLGLVLCEPDVAWSSYCLVIQADRYPPKVQIPWPVASSWPPRWFVKPSSWRLASDALAAASCWGRFVPSLWVVSGDGWLQKGSWFFV